MGRKKIYQTVEDSLVARKFAHERYVSRNKDLLRIRLKEWQRRNPKKVLLHSAKYKSKRDNLDFNLALKDIKIPELCPYLGIELVSGQAKRADNAPSIDRIDPNKGYTKENVEIISWLANKMKSSASHELLLTFAKSVIRRFDGPNT